MVRAERSSDQTREQDEAAPGQDKEERHKYEDCGEMKEQSWLQRHAEPEARERQVYPTLLLDRDSRPEG